MLILSVLGFNITSFLQLFHLHCQLMLLLEEFVGKVDLGKRQRVVVGGVLGSKGDDEVSFGQVLDCTLI